MSLEPLTWRHIRVNLPSSTLNWETIISAVFRGFQSTRYSDNSVRTPGSGVAWTSSIAANGTRILTPTSPTKTFSVQMDYYRAGINSSQATAFGHVLSNYYPMISFTIDGTYSATNVASPVSSGGRWFGWTYFWTDLVNYGVRFVDIFESQDALIICPVRVDGYGHPLLIGAIIDPGSEIQNSSSYNSETDGKVYGLCWGGDTGTVFNQGYIPTNFLTTPSGFLGSNAGQGNANYVQGAIMMPRTSTLLNLKKLLSVGLDKIPGVSTVSIDNGFGVVAKIPIYASSSKRFIGRYRELYLYKRTRGSLTIRENGQPIGHTVGYYINGIGSGDTILITR